MLRQMMSGSVLALVMVTALLLGNSRTATAGRCSSAVGFTGGLHCGLDSDPSPSHPTQACTQAAIDNLPLTCAAGETRVIYDLDKVFPPDGTSTSFATLRAAPGSPCASMTDTQPPLSGEVGAVTVPVAGFFVGCWSPPDANGCRMVKFLNGGSMCLHLGHQFLGSGCSAECQNVSTEQIAISNAGAADHSVCPPADPTISCRARRSPNPRGGRSGEKFRLWVGGFCSTNGCDNPGTDPQVGTNTCVAQWGATYLGYDRPPGKGVNAPGWYDWQSGALKVTYTNGKATCGTLDQCLGQGAGRQAPWDLSLVAVPRPSTPSPCLSGQPNPCNGQQCVP
jgi:hypothetical protein